MGKIWGKLVWFRSPPDMNQAGHLLKRIRSSIQIRVALCNILCFVIFSGNRNRRHNRCWTRVLPDCTLPRTLPQYLCLLDTTQDTAARPDWWHQGIHYGDWGYYAFVCMAMPQNVIATNNSRYLRELAGWEYREYQHMIVREGFRRLVLLVSRTRPPVLQSSYKWSRPEQLKATPGASNTKSNARNRYDSIVIIVLSPHLSS